MEECVDAARLKQGHLLGVAQLGIGLVLDALPGLLLDDRFGRRVFRCERPVEVFELGGPQRDSELLQCGLKPLLDSTEVKVWSVDAGDACQQFGGLVQLVVRRTFEGRDLLRRDVRGQAERPLDRDLPVAECLVGKDLRLLGLLEGQERVRDLADVVVGELAVLLAQVLAQGLTMSSRR